MKTINSQGKLEQFKNFELQNKQEQEVNGAFLGMRFNGFEMEQSINLGFCRIDYNHNMLTGETSTCIATSDGSTFIF